MKTIYLFFFFWLICGNICAQKGQLLIISQASDSLFRQAVLPKTEQLAQEQKLDLNQWDISKGLPAAITSSPAIIFQNERGRSIYAGRYMDKNSISNFLRTARLVPQNEQLLVKKQLPVLQKGRMKIGIPIKVTPLQGELPEKFNAVKFIEKAQQSLLAGMKEAVWADSLALQRSDRLFYLDVHPYIENQQLYLSYAIFSQFNCIKPVLEQFTEPIAGNWEEQEDLWKKVGNRAVQSILSNLKASATGDAYSPIGAQVIDIPWDSLGLIKPTSTNTNLSSQATNNQPMPSRWTYLGAVDADLPILQFRFAEPLSRYAGEIREMDGQLVFDQQQQLQQGNFIATVGSLTMGVEDFDQKVLKSYVKAKRFPQSLLQIKQVISQSPLAWGQTSDILIDAQLQLLKNNEPVQIRAKLLPFINQEGQARLLVEAQFSSNITQGYGIKGPDGPSPARETLEFFGYFLMEASSLRSE